MWKLGRFVPNAKTATPIKDDITLIKTVTLDEPKITYNYTGESRSMADVVKARTDKGRLPYVMSESTEYGTGPAIVRKEKFTKQFPLS